MANLLVDLQQRLGPAPRRLSPEQRDLLRAGEPPQWVQADGVLSRAHEAQDAVHAQGEVMLGVLAMAHTALWRPGPDDHACAVVYSNDPVFGLQPRRLAEVGSWLFRHHGYPSGEAALSRSPWVRWTHDLVGTGFEAYAGATVPPSFTGGRRVWHGSMLLRRGALPGGVGRSLLLPLLVWRSPEGHLPLVVDHRLWPAAHRDRWLAAAAP